MSETNDEPFDADVDVAALLNLSPDQMADLDAQSGQAGVGVDPSAGASVEAPADVIVVDPDGDQVVQVVPAPQQPDSVFTPQLPTEDHGATPAIQVPAPVEPQPEVSDGPAEVRHTPPRPASVPEAGPLVDVPPPTQAPVRPLAPAPEAVPTTPPSTADTDSDGPATTRLGAPILENGRPELERLLIGLVQNGGSDMHLTPGEAPRYRVHGGLLPVAGEPLLTHESIETLMRDALRPDQWDEYVKERDLDCAYAMDEAQGAALTCRFRVNVFQSMGKTGAVLRVIPTDITTLDDLGVPAQIKKLAERPRGLILVTGPTGSGKMISLSTTIPTPTGTTTMGALEVGDRVLGRDGTPCLVTSLSPVSQAPDLYRVHFSDGQTVLADGEHQWLVASHHQRSVPRTKKRQQAIARYQNGLMDAAALDELGAHWAGAESMTSTELFDLVVEQRLDSEFPGHTSVYEALRMTDCPRHDGVRVRHIEKTVTHRCPASWWPTIPVLEKVAAARSRGSKAGERAADLLENPGSLPTEATAQELADLLGLTQATVREHAHRAGIPSRLGAFEHTFDTSSSASVPVVEYPTAIALKSLAVRLRQRFATMPLDQPELNRMTTNEMIAAGVHLKQGHSNFAAPITAPLQFPEADLPLDPYILGAWLGDGSTGGGQFTQGTSEECTDTETGETDQALLIRVLEAAGFPASAGPDGKTVGTRGLRARLRRAGVLKCKHVPMPYLRASVSQRLALLQGLMDTDGTVDANGTCELSLSDRRLATDALDLIRSLGIKASVSWDQPASYRGEDGELVECKDRHRIHFTTDQSVFRLPRKARRLPGPGTLRETSQWLYITGIEPVGPADPDYGPARCITVDSPDHTYLCGDGYVVTSNSTTLAGLVDLINETRTERIFTLEDPVEFTHISKKCMVSHREIGYDTPSFEEGLRRVRREDPDIILIGEMRDYSTIAAAIEAADTGHLVLATLHTSSAPETISRIVNQFPANQQDQVRVTLSSTLEAIICQTLVPSPASERGRVLACEIMMVTPAIRSNIRENDIPAIAGALIDRSKGSMSLDTHLAELVKAGKITVKEALKKCTSPESLRQILPEASTESRF